MHIDIMVPSVSWSQSESTAQIARDAGFSGMVFTEGTQPPWMSLAVAARAVPDLDYSTGVAMAFVRSPMVTAGIAWELAEATSGRFRLGLGTQVRAHVERRYGMPFDPAGPRMRDYIEAVQACLSAFRNGTRLDHEGPYYQLTLLPPTWRPRRHSFEDIKIDISAVGPWMCRMAGEVADGIIVHPFHTLHYLDHRLIPALTEGAARAGRHPGEIQLSIPVIAVPGDTPEDRAPMLARAREQIAFYGSTRNYSFMFDDVGFEGLSARLDERLKAGDHQGMNSLIDEEVLMHFCVECRWEDMADKLIERYAAIATRLVMYLASESIAADPASISKWREVARVVRSAGLRPAPVDSDGPDPHWSLHGRS